MKTNQRAPDARGRQPIAWAAHDTPVEGGEISCDGCSTARQIALAGAGTMECRLNPRSPTVHTWLHVLSGSPKARSSGQYPLTDVERSTPNLLGWRLVR